MARSRTDEHPELLNEGPDEVWITVIPRSRGPSLRERVAKSGMPASVFTLIGLGVLAVAILAVVLALSLGGTAGSAHSRAAAAYARLPRCPDVTSTVRRRGITLAEFDRAVWCERYRNHPNASIDQFVGAP